MIFAPSPPFPRSPIPPTTSFRPNRYSIVASAACAEKKTSSYSSSSSSSSSVKLASSIPATSSFYKVLGISMGATSEEVKVAYRKLARVCHPDVAAIDRKETSADEFMRIHAAYSTLSDPEKRADYDRSLFRRHRSFGSYSGLRASDSQAVMSTFNGYTGRNWETDQCW